MHNYDDVTLRSVEIGLSALREIESRVVNELCNSASTIHVKNLQAVQLQRAIIAVGVFSMFEAHVQDSLRVKNGFSALEAALLKSGNFVLLERLKLFMSAVNVLKHGVGRSYDSLLADGAVLPFRIKKPGEAFFFEGDLSEVNTLIEVDEEFVRNCVGIISESSEQLRALGFSL